MRKPNVIIILADDLGYGDVGCNGSTHIRTPNIDRMAAEGARLTDFYASANVCTPSRAGLLTGRYAIRSGLAHEVIQPADTTGLPLGEITIPKALKPDYATALIGKWHLGYPPHFGPLRSGYEEFFGPMAGGVDYFTHKASTGDHDLWWGEQEHLEIGYLTDLLSQRAVDYVNRMADLASAIGAVVRS